MAVFPEIATRGFKEVQFFGHISVGFSEIKKYWQLKEKCCAERILWFYSVYKRKGNQHTIVLNVKPAARGCADFRIVLQASSPSGLHISETSIHRITEDDLLGMFRMLTRPKKGKEILPIRFTFRRIKKLQRALFLKDANAPYAIRGFKLQGSERNPIAHIDVEEVKAGHVLVEVASKPVYGINRDNLDSRFFSKPLQDMEELSDAIIKKIEESIHAKRITF